MSLTPELRAHALAAKGFMPPEEGDALYEAALEAAQTVPGAPFVEVGSYCGRSTIWLGGAALAAGTVLFAVDHHRGSEENQPGWEWHDPTIVDPRIGEIDTLPFMRAAVHDAGLEDVVIAVVGRSPLVAAHWQTPLALCFIDGGHGAEPARQDHDGWAHHVAPGGLLAIHDVFEDPADGGQAPYEQIYLRALATGTYEDASRTGSLRVLRRLPTI